jgi:hypothetical protein
MPISTEQIQRMTATANDIGKLMGEADWPDLKVWQWVAMARDELCECCSPITRLHDLCDEMNMVDRMLDVIENRRAAVRSATVHLINTNSRCADEPRSQVWTTPATEAFSFTNETNNER